MTPGNAAALISLSKEQRLILLEVAGFLNRAVALDSCPVCASDQPIKLYSSDRYGLPLKSQICGNCGAIFFNKYMSDGDLKFFYRNYYQALYGRSGDVDKYFSDQYNRTKTVFDRIEDSLPPICPGIIWLEVGSGAGGGLKYVEQKLIGSKAVGLEYDNRLRSYADGKDVISYDPEQFNPEEKFDYIFLYHVFEHISSPVEQLKKFKEWLRPHGWVIIVVPDIYRIHESKATLGNPRMFVHIAHFLNYSKKSFEILANNAELEMYDIIENTARESPELILLLRNSSPYKRSGFYVSDANVKYLKSVRQRYRFLCLKVQWVNLAYFLKVHTKYFLRRVWQID